MAEIKRVCLADLQSISEHRVLIKHLLLVNPDLAILSKNDSGFIRRPVRQTDTNPASGVNAKAETTGATTLGKYNLSYTVYINLALSHSTPFSRSPVDPELIAHSIDSGRP